MTPAHSCRWPAGRILPPSRFADSASLEFIYDRQTANFGQLGRINFQSGKAHDAIPCHRHEPADKVFKLINRPRQQSIGFDEMIDKILQLSHVGQNGRSDDEIWRQRRIHAGVRARWCGRKAES